MHLAVSYPILQPQSHVEGESQTNKPTKPRNSNNKEEENMKEDDQQQQQQNIFEKERGRQRTEERSDGRGKEVEGVV